MHFPKTQNIVDILSLHCYDQAENAEATSALFHDIHAIRSLVSATNGRNL